MSDFVVVNDSCGNVFRHVVKFDFDADAIWFRFNSAADVFRLAEGIVPRPDAVNAFLLTKVINGPSNPRLSEFQGAYGRAKLHSMNKNKIFRKKLVVKADNFFLDGAPVQFGEDWKGYLRAVYNDSFGILIGGSSSPSSLIDNAFDKSNLSEFLSHVVNNCDFAGLFVEDHRGTRSIVLIGRALSHSITPATDWTYETPATTLECVRAYGDRLADRYLLEKVLRCEEQ